MVVVVGGGGSRGRKGGLSRKRITGQTEWSKKVSENSNSKTFPRFFRTSSRDLRAVLNTLKITHHNNVIVILSHLNLSITFVPSFECQPFLFRIFVHCISGSVKLSAVSITDELFVSILILFYFLFYFFIFLFLIF